MRKHVGKLILAILLSCILAVVLIWRHVDNTVRNCYAQWWVADMVILHLNANDQQWPQSWNDLRDDYEVCIKRSGKPWTFEELSERVTVDWSAETDSLRSLHSGNSTPSFRVIWPGDGSSAHWESREPNSMIADYLTLHPPAENVTEPVAEPALPRSVSH